MINHHNGIYVRILHSTSSINRTQRVLYYLILRQNFI